MLPSVFCSDQQPGFFDIFYKIRIEEDTHNFTLRFVSINDKTTPEAEHELDLSQDLTSPQVCAAVESDMSSPYNLKLTFTCMRNQSNASFVGKYKAKIYKYIGNVPSAENLTPITSSTGNDVGDVAFQERNIFDTQDPDFINLESGLYTSTIYVHIVTDFPQ